MMNAVDLFGMGMVDTLIRVTAVLLVSLTLAWLVRRRPAGVRHGLWTTTFVALLLLPMGTVLMPGWELSVLPATMDRGASMLQGMDAGDQAASDAAALNQDPSTQVQSQAIRETVEQSTAGATIAPSANRSGGVASPLALLWALGTFAALVSLVVGMVRFRARIRTAAPVTDSAWARQVERLRTQLGVSRPVAVLVSPAVQTPMTGGLLRPVVLLPDAALGWTPARRDVVLAHELVHVRRYDALRQLVGHVALALYWFHPLSWYAARSAVLSREQACDEEVLDLGTQPSVYATHLLELATGLSRTPELVSLPMVQRPHLEKRIMAILAHRHPRSARLTTTFVLLAVGSVALSAAVTRPVPVRSAAETAEVPAGAEDVPLGAVEAPARAMDVVAGAMEVRAEPPDARASALSHRESIPPTAQEIRCFSEGSISGTFRGSFDIGGGRSERSGWHNGDRVIQKYDGDLRLCMRIHGEVVFADDGLSVRAVGRDSWVVLESEEDRLWKLVVTEGPDGIDQQWSIDGADRTFDTEAREWRDHMFTLMNGFWEASRLRGQQSSLRGRISSYRGEVSSMRGKISSHQGHVSSLRGQISSARGRQSSLRGEISSLNGTVSSLEGQISSHRGRMSSLRSAAPNSSGEETRQRLEEELAENERQIQDLERQIQEFDLEGRVAEVEREIAGSDVEGRVRAIEQEIEDYDLDGKVREIEQQIEDFDLLGKVREVEGEIEALDADSRAEEIERRLEPELDALRRMMRN